MGFSDILLQQLANGLVNGAGYILIAVGLTMVFGVLRIVKPGGTIILAADLTEGIGSPEFQSLFQENADLDQFMTRITGQDAERPDYFVMDQWQLEEMAKVCRKAEVVYVSGGLSDDVLRTLFVKTAPTVEEALEAALEKHGRDALVALANVHRDYAREHPGRIEAAGALDVPLTPDLEDAAARVADLSMAVLRGYPIPKKDHVHAVRLMASLLRGFIELEVGGAFAHRAPSSATSWARVLDVLDRTLSDWR